MKLPVPSPSRMETVACGSMGHFRTLTTARSSLPSPLKSPTATEWDRNRSRRRGQSEVAIAVPEQDGNRAAVELATAKSSLPSPLKSPTATDKDRSPPLRRRGQGKVARCRPPAGWKACLELQYESRPLATAKSSLPSPLKSPTATEWGSTDPQSEMRPRRIRRSFLC